MKNWSVDEVSFLKVVMTFGNIRCIFYWKNNNTLIVCKESNAQIYDPANLYIPKKIFRKMYKQALAILNDHRQRQYKKLIKSEKEPSLFD